MNEKFAYEIKDYNVDSALCNRLFFWEIAYDISKKNNFKYKIIVTEPWLELDYITLPKTEKYNKNLHINLNEYIVVMHDCIIVCGDKLNTIGYDFINKKYDIISSISFIKLNNYIVEDFIKNKMKNLVGIHIRRNRAVCYTLDDVKSLPEHLQKEYINLRTDNYFEPQFKFIQDKIYFSIIDKILEIFPTQLFYISADIPYNLYSYYKEKYPKNIFTKENILEEIQYYLSTSEPELKIELSTLENIVDLFCLSFCKFLIKSNNSTWSLFAEHYRNQPSVFATDNIENIKEEYLIKNWNQLGNYKIKFYGKNLF